jgi:hypothetical protein
MNACGWKIRVLRVQLGEISEAVRSVVPQSMWAAFVKKLEQHSEALDVGAEGRMSLPDQMTDRYPADPSFGLLSRRCC